MKQVLIYLHGFLSSPASVKAQATQAYWQAHHPDITFVCPQLPYYPEEAKRFLDELLQTYADARLGFVGSSLGGFLSTYLMEQCQAKAVLINPAAKPHEVLSDYLGEHQHPYTNEKFTLTAEHMQQFLSMYSKVPTTPENYWVLLQTDDETLDYREAETKYRGAKFTIEQGGDHAFQGYERFLPDIFRFLFD